MGFCSKFRTLSRSKTIRRSVNIWQSYSLNNSVMFLWPMVYFGTCVKQPLGAADYLEICKNFDIILLRDIPQMSLDNRSATRRFITLIDTLYDQKVFTSGSDNLLGLC